MSNDKLFGIYALGLVAMVGTLWWTLVALGVATFPAAAFLMEHVALGLCVRAAYKSFAGFDWLFAGLRLAGMITAEEPAVSEPAHLEPEEAGLAAAA